eukprot:7381077-Prymnesium_polylepis.1
MRSAAGSCAFGRGGMVVGVGNHWQWGSKGCLLASVCSHERKSRQPNGLRVSSMLLLSVRVCALRWTALGDSGGVLGDDRREPRDTREGRVHATPECEMKKAPRLKIEGGHTVISENFDSRSACSSTQRTGYTQRNHVLHHNVGPRARTWYDSLYMVCAQCAVPLALRERALLRSPRFRIGTLDAGARQSRLRLPAGQWRAGHCAGGPARQIRGIEFSSATRARRPRPHVPPPPQFERYLPPRRPSRLRHPHAPPATRRRPHRVGAC